MDRAEKLSVDIIGGVIVAAPILSGQAVKSGASWYAGKRNILCLPSRAAKDDHVIFAGINRYRINFLSVRVCFCGGKRRSRPCHWGSVSAGFPHIGVHVAPVIIISKIYLCSFLFLLYSWTLKRHK